MTRQNKILKTSYHIVAEDLYSNLLNNNVCVTGQNLIQVKILEPKLILYFLCLLALFIHELGLGELEN